VDAGSAAALFGSLQRDSALEHHTVTAPCGAGSTTAGVYANAATSTCRLRSDRTHRMGKPAILLEH
jgi:hypothetical protein